MHSYPSWDYALFRRNIARTLNENRQVRANHRARLEPRKFLRILTPDFHQRCAYTVAQRIDRTLVSDGPFAEFER
jgi:hypothetical protein